MLSDNYNKVMSNAYRFSYVKSNTFSEITSRK